MERPDPRVEVFARERQQLIARLVQEHGRARVADLAERFGVSAVTIRKRCRARPRTRRATTELTLADRPPMIRLRIEPTIATPDDLYEALLDAHRGLTLEQSQALNARLVLLLANHVGDIDVVREALEHARNGLVETPGVDTRDASASG